MNTPFSLLFSPQEEKKGEKKVRKWFPNGVEKELTQCTPCGTFAATWGNKATSRKENAGAHCKNRGQQLAWNLSKK